MRKWRIYPCKSSQACQLVHSILHNIHELNDHASQWTTISCLFQVLHTSGPANCRRCARSRSCYIANKIGIVREPEEINRSCKANYDSWPKHHTWCAEKELEIFGVVPEFVKMPTASARFQLLSPGTLPPLYFREFSLAASPARPSLLREWLMHGRRPLFPRSSPFQLELMLRPFGPSLRSLAEYSPTDAILVRQVLKPFGHVGSWKLAPSLKNTQLLKSGRAFSLENLLANVPS